MKGIAIYDAKARFSELLAAVQAGEEFNITKHGKPVARLVGVPPDATRDKGRRKAVADAFARLRKMRKGIRLEGDTKTILAEGRE